ncbi:MAG: hypothetical protein B7C24_09630 [Bacteroidetes bacterium 4572_77]|nr:MAG: hypothetical protein B7C24_09630 [Bacteroidetes bacterium 4572_77]
MKVRLALVVLIGIFVLSNVNISNAQERVILVESKTKSIMVKGTAVMEVEPDELYFQIIISKSKLSGKKSVEQLEDELIEGLEKIGVAQKDITLVDFDSYVDEKWFSSDEIEQRRTYKLLLHNTKTSGKLYKLCKRIGISDVSMYATDISNRINLTKEMRVKAIKNAKEKAIYMLEAIDEKVGSPISVNLQDYAYNNRSANSVAEFARMADMAYEDKYETPNIQKISISATVNAEFEILEKE